jgi:3'-phosphoadenosine 5'-phosphosulfate sulfotransferase (PAPS reductase)/FAD synthetase
MTEIVTGVSVAEMSMEDRALRLGALIQEAHGLVDLAVETYGDGKEIVGTVVLFSGGNDSTILAHLMRARATHAAHINTGIGVEATREYVRQTCRDWGLPLIEEHPPPGSTYRELVLDQGFPGPGMHWKMYHRLKERGLRKVRKSLVLKPRQQRVVFLAGRRRDESARRALVPEMERQGSVIWSSPLVNWTSMDMNTYRRLNPDCPENQVSAALHMSGECLCLAPGTLVATGIGWQPIQDLAVGELVQTCVRGQVVLSPVAAVQVNEPKPMLTVKPHYLLPVTATDNHPFWVRDFKYRLRKAEEPRGEPRFAEARELHEAHIANQDVSVSKKRMHYVGRPFRTEETSLGLSEHHLRLLGYFVSEGAYQWKRGHRAGIVFTMSWKSRSMAEDIAECLEVGLGVHAGWREYTDKRTGREFIMIRSGRTDVSDFVGKYITGRYCWEKSFSENVMVAPTMEQQVILDAAWIGDGSEFVRYRDGSRIEVSTYGSSSRNLALQVQEMLLRSGRVYGIHQQFNASHGLYQVRSEGTAPKAFIEDGVLWSSVASVEEAAPQETFNLTIAGEPNFLTEGGLVHNCGAFAVRGELDEIAFFYPEVAEHIRDLEMAVREARPDLPAHRCQWGWGSSEAGKMDKQIGVEKRRSEQLCSSCDWRWDEAQAAHEHVDGESLGAAGSGSLLA